MRADGLAPARLAVGVVSAGRVGTAIAEALERAGHVVGAVVASSTASRERAAARLPESQILPLDQVVARSELLVIAVPDAVLPTVVGQIAAGGALRRGTVVLHTAGAHGVGILAPLSDLGALALAVHPAMTFVGGVDDTNRLATSCFGITAADEIGYTIAQSLVYEIGGQPVRIAEADRTLYHAALAHGANHLVALISDALAILDVAVARGAAYHDEPPVRAANAILGPLVTAALSNVLDLGPAALTGPVARGDADAVAAHLAALRELPDTGITAGIPAAYIASANRAAVYADAPPKLRDLLSRAGRNDTENR
ncbi:DUF2520 domain-containing protein [Gordonia sp. TBRC 11910]|uniref:DUF2520 domain-containing protein n=1 Tax=Gordonia asplenii TaxID=2725283 RepID=A0A848LB29_9ACTN|nr:DUF2520 domain-containing protein [Gordonia asplenii]NMO04788.1 DUF2520 domain-containing protein [Gordonia asplenii]